MPCFTKKKKKRKKVLADVQKCEVLLGSECGDAAPTAHNPHGVDLLPYFGSCLHKVIRLSSTGHIQHCWMKEQEGLAFPTPGNIILMVHILLHTSRGQQEGLPTRWCSTSLSCALPSFPLAFYTLTLLLLIYQSYL